MVANRMYPSRWGGRSGASIVFAFCGGEHGSLTRPRTFAPPACPTFTICPVAPSRDDNDERGLKFKARVAWVSGHSTKTMCLFPDLTHHDASWEGLWSAISLRA